MFDFDQAEMDVWMADKIETILEFHPEGLTEEEIHDILENWYMASEVIAPLIAKGLIREAQEPCYKISEKGVKYVEENLLD